MTMRTTAPFRVRGHVTFTETDDLGRIIREVEADNTFTDAYASLLAQALAAGSPTLPLTHIALGGGGVSIDRCESVSGWNAGVLDTTILREGTGSVKATQTASTSGLWAHADAIAATDLSAMAIEVWIRVATRANTDLTNTRVYVFSGTGTSHVWQVSLATIEGLAGAFTDGVWKRVAIPRASFSVNAGSPVWTNIRGGGIYLAANAGGTAVVHIDDLRGVYTALHVGATETALADSRTKRALTSLVYSAPLTLTAKAYWTAGEPPMDCHVAALWGGSAGAVLAAIVAADFTKTAGFNLTVTWTLTFAGG